MGVVQPVSKEQSDQELVYPRVARRPVWCVPLQLLFGNLCRVVGVREEGACKLG